MRTNINPIIITPGEPAGIGPDIILYLSQKKINVPIVVCASKKMLYERAKKLNISIKLLEYKKENIEIHVPGSLYVLHIDTEQPVVAGKLCIENAIYVLKTLEKACDGCLKGKFSALITGPINKSIINRYGITFKGHTDFLAKKSFCNQVIMMLMTQKMKVALLTRHIPLKQVVKKITKKFLYNTLLLLNTELKTKFNILKPHIFICGINPHAGENGYIGNEEKKIIIPVLKKIKIQGIKITGPLPADTIFQNKYLKKADVILAMYHDQGLPVLKYHGFGKAVNITLGLPFLRVSVDHGSALDLAGTGKCQITSLLEALKITKNFLKNNE